MKVLLAGLPQDRDRVRPALARAGFAIAGEIDEAPATSALPDGVDAIIVAAPRRSRLQLPRALDVDIPPEALTPRERETLLLMAEGLPNKAIAQALGISDQTVKFHVAAIIAKLGAANRTDAVRRAIRRGLVAI
jgi:DNA-binding NarL/FixJ family response regulator